MARKVKVVAGIQAQVLLPTFQQMREERAAAEAEAAEAEKQQGLPMPAPHSQTG